MPKRLAVLLWITLLCSIGAMSAYGSGAKDQIDPALTDDVEALLEHSVLSEFAGLEPTPLHQALGHRPGLRRDPAHHRGGTTYRCPTWTRSTAPDGPPLVVLPAPVAPDGGRRHAGARCAA